jgi:hypothetical protein
MTLNVGLRETPLKGGLRKNGIANRAGQIVGFTALFGLRQITTWFCANGP